jgi:hypothetical protein
MTTLFVSALLTSLSVVTSSTSAEIVLANGKYDAMRINAMSDGAEI